MFQDKLNMNFYFKHGSNAELITLSAGTVEELRALNKRHLAAEPLDLSSSIIDKTHLPKHGALCLPSSLVKC